MKKVYLLYLLPILYTACSTGTRKYHKQYLANLKYEQMRQLMYYPGDLQPGDLLKIRSDEALRDLKRQVQAAGNSQAGLQKIMLAEYLKKETVTITSKIEKLIIDLTPYSTNNDMPTVQQFLTSDNTSYSARGLVKSLDEYASELKKRHLKYLSDTTSWSRRYLRLIPPAQRKKAPDFGDFYFKNTTRHEAIIILYAIEYGILKEALDISHKIAKDK